MDFKSMTLSTMAIAARNIKTKPTRVVDLQKKETANVIVITHKRCINSKIVVN